MKATLNGRKDAGIRLSDEIRRMLSERAQANSMTRSEYVAYLVRQEAQQARAEAMFAERNEYDR